jgi:HEXXH motif-containing protein
VAFKDNVLYLRQQGIDCALPLSEENDKHIRSPFVEHAGCRLRLQPQALAGLGLKSVDDVLAEGDGYPRRHTELLRNALAAIERFAPDVFEQISGTIRVVGLKSNDGDFTNVSFSELPGAMLLSVVDHPLVMADRIIHEFHHNRLFHIEDCGSLFEPQSPTKEDFYSPWRNDRRPLKGVLHGLYVFIAVGRFWRRVHLQGELSSYDRSLVTDQLLRISRQVILARDELARNARFTPPGQGLFAQLSSDVDELHDQIAALGLPHDAPAMEVRDDGSIAPQMSRETKKPLSVREAIDEHRLSFSQTESQ